MTGKKGIKLSKVYCVNFVGEDGFTQGVRLDGCECGFDALGVDTWGVDG